MKPKLVEGWGCVHCGLLDTTYWYETDGHFRCEFCGHEFSDDSIDTSSPAFLQGLEDAKHMNFDESDDGL